MRLTKYFLPVLKENPAEAHIVSHRLMLRAGLVQQQAAGIYAWLPLGFKVLKKIEAIVRDEQERAGSIELLMPTIQSADLWKQSGRYQEYGKEMLRIQDRHQRDLLYGPTNEEMITAIFSSSARSYRELPRNLFHIQWKFRDEVRPRFGVMRGREFLMKDGYSFDVDVESGRRSYRRMFVSYLRTFERMGLRAIPMAAQAGPIGGDLSHEFSILAETGESQIFCHRDLMEMSMPSHDIDYDSDLEPIVERWTKPYARADDKHDPAVFEAEVAPNDRLEARGIEVGHVFFFGSKYSEPLEATVSTPEGRSVPLQSGSYGIGVSRLVGAIIEAHHDDAGIIWPESVAPFRVGLVNLGPDKPECVDRCESLYKQLNNAGVETLFDDTSENPGVKLSRIELIGLPWQLRIGPRSLKKGIGEIQTRRTGESIEVPLDNIVERINNILEKSSA